jgi:Tfp pilus assembly protein PilF
MRTAVELDPKDAWTWTNLGHFLANTPGRLSEAEAAFGKALEIGPGDAAIWGQFGFFLACRAGQPSKAEAAFRNSVELDPDSTKTLRNLGVLLVCEGGSEEGGVQFIRRARQPDRNDAVSPAVATAILAACVRGSEAANENLLSFMAEACRPVFWDELLDLCRNYAPFGKILLRLCDLVEEHDTSNKHVRLHRAVALAQLADFPRASVALEDALVGDPIELLTWGRRALETFFAAAVKNGRVRECLHVIDKKEWFDAWRPIYEALKSVDEGSGDYLKRVAVEIREPAQAILRRIAPEIPGLTA